MWHVTNTISTVNIKISSHPPPPPPFGSLCDSWVFVVETIRISVMVSIVFFQ